MREYDTKIKEFVNDINRKYEDETVLNSFRNVTQHNEDEHQGPYIQIGLRTGLPKEYFDKEESYLNRRLAEQFAKRIVEGEKKFIAQSCIDAVDHNVKSITSKSVPDFSDLERGIRQLPDPDHLFVPMYREFHKQVNEWIRRRGSFTDGGSINLGSSEVRVHWLSTDMDIRNLTLVDSSYLRIRQKYGGQSPVPQGVDIIEEFDAFTEGEKVICTFGRREDEDDKFDFVYRTVISEINPTKYSSFVINIPSSVELTE